MFITFEGIDNSGKTSQAKLMVEKLAQMGMNCIYTREPGGTELAEEIRNLILNKEIDKWNELALFIVARNDHYKSLILPMLKKNTIVICDRFIDSSISYQGYGYGMNINKIYELHIIIMEQLIIPDLTLIIDIDPEIALKRHVEKTKFEDMDYSFHKKVRQGFIEIYTKEKNIRNIELLDGNQKMEVIAKQIQAKILAKIKNIS